MGVPIPCEGTGTIRSRLLIDVTRTVDGGLHSGIQRVVRGLYRGCLAHAAHAGISVHAVRCEGQDWIDIGGLEPHPLEAHGAAATIHAVTAPTRIEPRRGDTLLLADASWYYDPWPAVDALLEARGRLAGFIHDLLPMREPDWFRPGTGARFERYIAALTARAAMLIVSSEHVAGQLSCLNNLSRHAPADLSPIGVNPDDHEPVDPDPAGLNLAMPALATPGLANPYLANPDLAIVDLAGPDFDHRIAPISVIPLASSLNAAGVTQQTKPPFFLAVATLEPRKNHALMLDAFDALWRNGNESQLLLVGAPGWCNDALLRRIEQHPQLGERLQWLRDLSDATLTGLYRTARALLYLPDDEGFGLPVLEARELGCPVIASDIAPLREAGGDWPLYIPVGDRAALLHALGRDPAPSPSPVTKLAVTTRPSRSWDDVGGEMLRVLELTSTKRAVVGPATTANPDAGRLRCG